MEATILQRFDDEAVYKALGGLLFLRYVCCLHFVVTHISMTGNKFFTHSLTHSLSLSLTLQRLDLFVRQLQHLIIMDCWRV
jgi:hypothetical protein